MVRDIYIFQSVPFFSFISCPLSSHVQQDEEYYVPSARKKVLRARNESLFFREPVPLSDAEIGPHLFELITVDGVRMDSPPCVHFSKLHSFLFFLIIIIFYVDLFFLC